MSTTSEVSVGIDAIASRINDNRQTMIKVKANATSVSAALASIPTDFAAVIATVQAFGNTDPYVSVITP